jgi:hypothetical protein
MRCVGPGVDPGKPRHAYRRLLLPLAACGPAPSRIVANAYTLEQFTRLMRTGEVAAGGQSKTGMMSGVAAYCYKVLTDEKIAALKLFLDSR